ncbi:hypothetical protein EMIT0133MI5_70048 [Bacillus velezensis]
MKRKEENDEAGRIGDPKGRAGKR